MAGEKTLRELLIANGFKIADPDDPIYKRHSTIIVSPISAWLETQSQDQEQSQNSDSEPLDLTNLPFDPATAAGEASLRMTESKPKDKK